MLYEDPLLKPSAARMPADIAEMLEMLQARRRGNGSLGTWRRLAG
jgi:hypothetical protein